MGYDSARAAIESRWRTLWTVDSTTLRTPTVFGDAKVWLTRVDQTLSATEAPKTAAWVRVTTVFSPSAIASLPYLHTPGQRETPLIRTPARIWLQVHAPKGAGAGALDRLCDLAVPIFECREFSGLRCFERQWVSAMDDERWHIRTLNIPFEFDEVAAP